MKWTRQSWHLGVTFGLLIGLASINASAQETAPTAKDVEMKPAPKLAVPQIEKQSAEKIQSLPDLDEKYHSERSYSVDEFRLHLLKQEMQFNPELKEKVDALVQIMRDKQQAEKPKQTQKRQKNLDGWIFDNLRMVYESQGKELPEMLSLAEKGDQASQDGGEEGYQDPLAEWQRAGTKMAKITGLTEESIDGRERLGRTSMSITGTSLAERLKANRDRMAEAKEISEASVESNLLTVPDPMASLQQPLNDISNPFVLSALGGQQTAESKSDVQTWQGGQYQPTGENAEMLAEIEVDSAKDTFQPGELQWFENSDDTLPVASPQERIVMNQGLIQGEMDMYMDQLKELDAELMTEEGGIIPGRQLSEANLNRPNIDIPMEQFIQKASRNVQQIRKAEQIQQSVAKSKELRTKMLRPKMDIQTTQRLMTPHDLLGPNAFRAWEREKYGKERRRGSSQREQSRDPFEDFDGQNLN